MRCQNSGVIFLSRSDHIDATHYENQADFNYWGPNSSRQQAILDCFEDDSRRAKQFEVAIRNKKWLDFGTGAGGILDLLSHKALETWAIEPQTSVQEELNRCGYKVYADLDSLPDDYFDTITLFHVFEHLITPIEILQSIMTKLAKGGQIIIEVPHANDFLISFLGLESFKQFTFWSEHLILHTRQSLTNFMEQANIQDICVQGFQRYPLANHLHWLAQNKPGGHQHWHHLCEINLDTAYANLLARLDQTDTLIAIGKKQQG
jgi:2-polyprenyl-3-methyl-5-hydroxy-6-metoxy-1,4-benzoquinol methylase